MNTKKSNKKNWKCPTAQTFNGLELKQKLSVNACSYTYGCQIYPVCYVSFYK